MQLPVGLNLPQNTGNYLWRIRRYNFILVTLLHNMRPKLQKQRALKLAGRIIREAEDNATSRVLHRVHPPA